MTGTSELRPLPALDGRTVVLTRSPDRAGTMFETLKATGARMAFLPVIDFEVPADTSALDEALDRLASGGFNWLVVTSITTVRALAQRCAALGLDMAALVPEHTQVAAVGDTTRKALEAEGIVVDLTPAGERSGQGLLHAWPAGKAVSVLLPQADIADPALGEGLRHLGADVVGLTAYHTVNYPADPPRRLDQSLAMAGGAICPGAPVWTAQDFAARQLAGGVDALVLTSPSAARRVSEECGALDNRVKVVAIGRPTAWEAERCGLPVSGVAAEPSGQGIAAALEQALDAGTES